MGFLELRRQCAVSHEVRRGAQGASRVAPGKSGLHVRGEGALGLRGKAGGGARVTAGPKRPHLSVCPGPNAGSVVVA